MQEIARKLSLYFLQNATEKRGDACAVPSAAAHASRITKKYGVLLDEKKVAPISLRQALDFVEYYYIGWLLRKDPKNEELLAQQAMHKPSFAKAMLCLEGEERTKGLAFMRDIKALAFICAQEIAQEKKRLDERRAELAGRAEKKLQLLEERRARELEAIAKTYEEKKKTLEWVVEKRLPSMEQFLKTVALPIGGALTAAAGLTDWIGELVKTIPYLSSIPKESVGVAAALLLTGLFAALKGMKAALDWHMKVVNYRLNIRRAKAETRLAESILKQREEEREKSQKEAEALEAKFAERKEAILKKLQGEYARLVAAYGYSEQG
ncbi:MAG: pinin family protein [Candidatus Micrarchaeota archaeon]|nr:pinin family protein [Candidatus Micrarchaeota archaeon]